MNEKLTELFAKRASNFEAMKKLNDEVLARGGDYTAEETEADSRMSAEHEKLNKMIDIAERNMKIEAELKKDTRQKLFDGENIETTNDGARVTDQYKEVFVKMLRGAESLTSAERGVVENYRAVLNVTTPAQGGYLVPVAYQTTVLEKLRDANVMRRISSNMRTNSVTKIPLGANKPTFTWIAEQGAYGKTDLSFGQTSIDAFKSGGIVQLSDELLRDSMINIESYITSAMVNGMADLEELAFISGDGIGKPTGFLVNAELGKTTALGTAVTIDEILDLKYSLKSGYRGRANFLYNSKTELALRKLKDSTGNYLWQPSVVAGTPNTLDGTSAVISENMANIGASAKFMAFGDFSNFTIADRGVMTMKRLEELYAENGLIGFRVDSSCDSKLFITESIKYMIGRA